MLWYTLFGLAFIFFSLLIGALGYHYLGGLSWLDSFYNASMICAGMGPVDPLTSDAAKIFATIYSIYSGVAFLTSVGVIFAPLIHRLLHTLHAPLQDN
ncbi:MAG: hypothetical protein JNL57_00565 [Bacteroidetes bacterium]|nr:hypothetical protein [Bacteroidota bacterium]